MPFGLVPAKVVEVLSAPVVSVTPSRRITRPVPASEPIVSLALTSRITALAMVTATVSASAEPPLSRAVPSFSITGPVKVFATLSSSKPGPFLIKPPVPEIALLTRVVELPVPSLSKVSVDEPSPMPGPVKSHTIRSVTVIAASAVRVMPPERLAA